MSGLRTNVPDQGAPTSGLMVVRLRLGFAFGDPGRDVVVTVGEVILGNVVGRRVPDAVMAENIPQRLIEMLGGIGATDIVRMQRQPHHAPVFRTFSVDR